MATLERIVTAIRKVIQDDVAYPEPDLIDRCNDAVLHIAAGIRMPNGDTSPPLPDLYAIGTVTTSTTLAYVALPTDYQRGMFSVCDSAGDTIHHPNGGDYYAYQLFLNRVDRKDLTRSGSIYIAAIRGSSLYYQGIPSAAKTLTLHYYRKPVDMAALVNTPDGLPDHLALKLVKHYVCMEILGEGIEDGEDSTGTGYRFHAGKFYEVMTDLVDFIGIDAKPVYYAASGGGADLGRVDGW